MSTKSSDVLLHVWKLCVRFHGASNRLVCEETILASGVKFSWYRNREKEFRKYYAQDDQLVFCTDIRNLLHTLGEKNMILAPGVLLSTPPKKY